MIHDYSRIGIRTFVQTNMDIDINFYLYRSYFL